MQEVHRIGIGFPGRAGGRVNAGKAEPDAHRLPVRQRNENERQDVENDPEGLGQKLEAADQGDAMGDQRDHRHGAEDVADPQRYAEGIFEGARHDRGFDGEENEGEAGVDQRGEGGADVAETGAARQQVDIHPVARGIAGDGQAHEKQHRTARQNRGKGIGRAIGQGDGPADCFQSQKGNRPAGRMGNGAAGKAAGALGGEAQRIVFQGLVVDPLIVMPAHRQDALTRCHLCPFLVSLCPLSAQEISIRPPRLHRSVRCSPLSLNT